MSFLSAIGSLASSMTSSGGSLPLGDWSGGWTNYSSGQSKLKDALRRQYEYAQSYALNSPSWAVAGLRAAGLNPILAAVDGSFASPTLANANFPEGGSGATASFNVGKEAQKQSDRADKLNEAQVDLLKAQKLKTESDKINTDVDTFNKGRTFGLGGAFGAGSAIYNEAVDYAKRFWDWSRSSLSSFLESRRNETGVDSDKHMKSSSPSSGVYDDIVIPPRKSPSSPRDVREIHWSGEAYNPRYRSH